MHHWRSLESIAMKPTVWVALFCITFAACSSPREKFAAEEATAHAGVPGKSLEVRVLWVKHRGNALHFNLQFNNRSNEPLRLDGSSVSVKYEGSEGMLEKMVPPFVVDATLTRQVLYMFKFGYQIKKEGTAEITVKAATRDGRPLPAAKLTLPITIRAGWSTNPD